MRQSRANQSLFSRVHLSTGSVCRASVSVHIYNKQSPGCFSLFCWHINKYVSERLSWQQHEGGNVSHVTMVMDSMKNICVK